MDHIREVLPKQGMMEQDQKVMHILCKPKLMPLKSVTLEKLDAMQKEAQEIVKAQEMAERESGMMGFPGPHDMGDPAYPADRLIMDANDYEILTRQLYGGQ